MTGDFGTDGIIHATTQFWGTGVPDSGYWKKGNLCPGCGRPINDRAKTCKPCFRKVQLNRVKFAVHAAQTTHAEKVVRSHEQALRFMALRDVMRG